MTIENSTIDLRERGRAKDGTLLFSERRLYIQFLAFGECRDTAPLAAALESLSHPCVLYLDINDPQGVALLWTSEDPAFFAEEGRRFLNSGPFAKLRFKPEYAMLGRTYSIGYEPDLQEVLFNRPKSRLFDPALTWAVWYPVKRTKSFEALPEAEKHEVLMNHGGIGKLFGKSDLAHDIRLNCHGLDRGDNDFVIGILGKELIGPSAVVEAMRQSLQTMHHLDNLGPFFVGKVCGQFHGKTLKSV